MNFNDFDVRSLCKAVLDSIWGLSFESRNFSCNFVPSPNWIKRSKPAFSYLPKTCAPARKNLKLCYKWWLLWCVPEVPKVSQTGFQRSLRPAPLRSLIVVVLITHKICALIFIWVLFVIYLKWLRMLSNVIERFWDAADSCPRLSNYFKSFREEMLLTAYLQV